MDSSFLPLLTCKVSCRFSKSEADRGHLCIKLINGILIMLLWYDYLPVSSRNDGESSVEVTTGVEGDPFSNDRSTDAQNYSSSYIQELDRCIVNILMNVSSKEFGSLDDFYVTFLKDCSAVLKHRIFSRIIREYLRRIINFFLLIGQLPLQKGQTWPWEFLAGPLIASSFTTIIALVSLPIA